MTSPADRRLADHADTCCICQTGGLCGRGQVLQDDADTASIRRFGHPEHATGRRLAGAAR